MHFEYQPQGVCSRLVSFDLEDNKIHNVSFVGGCNGNLKAISRLVEGRDVHEVIETLQGNTCGMRPTSCADQFSKALLQALETIK